MKRLLLLFSAMCCMMVANATDFTFNGIRYNVTSEEDETVEVVANEYSGAVEIPANVIHNNVNYSVTKIGDWAFYECMDLTTVTIPGSVTEIGNNAFCDCSSLQSITFPEDLKSIGYSAFSSCNKLTSITIPSSVTEIGNEAFVDCGFSSIRVEEGNTVYDSRYNCNALIETATNTLIKGCKNTVIPPSVTTIGDQAFALCFDLASITIPGSVTSIGDGAFSLCFFLESVTLSEGLESIGGGTFNNCKSLASITIPSSVTEIGGNAFNECTGLNSMTVLASTPPTLGDSYVFDGVDKSIPVYVPIVNNYTSDTYWSSFTNFQAIDLEEYKEAAIAEINDAIKGVSLSGEESETIYSYIVAISNVKTMTEGSTAIIENAKNTALTIISQIKMRPVRGAAIAAIEEAIQGETSVYLTGLMQQYIDAINFLINKTDINNVRKTAVTVLNAAVAAYKAGKTESLGTLGTQQAGPAIEVIDLEGNVIKLYSPREVNFIKVPQEQLNDL